MSELSDLVGGINKIRLRQSREIARIIDRHNAEQKAQSTEAETDQDRGYGLAIALIAAALDKSPAEIEELGGSIMDLSALVPRVMELAGFASGEDRPATSLLTGGFSGSIAASPPAMDTPRRRSAK